MAWHTTHDPPPLPVQAGPWDWIVFANGWGRGSRQYVNTYSFVRLRSLGSTVHANVAAAAWDAYMGPLWSSTHGVGVSMGAPYAYCWIQGVYRTGISGVGAVGTLSTVNNDARRCVLIKRCGRAGNREVVSFWKSPIVNTLWTTGAYELNALGATRYGQFLTKFQGPLMIAGEAWQPAIQTQFNPQGITRIDRWQLYGTLGWWRKRGKTPTKKNEWLPPAIQPAVDG